MATSPQREFIKTFVTPKTQDVIFYEIRDSRLPLNEAPDIYGQEHPEKIKFPDHKLVLITPHDDEGVQKWFYAKDREDQADYNWEASYPFAGLEDFPVYSTEFVILRSEYEPLAKGTAHPLDLGDSTPVENLRFKESKLVLEETSTIDMQELRSLYIAVRRLYVTIPPLEAQLTHSVERTFPYAGLVKYPRITRNLVIPRQDFIPTAKDTPDVIFEDAKLFSEDQLIIDDESLESLFILVRRKYDEVASLVDQETYNAETSYPYQGSIDFPRITRTYVVRRVEYEALEVNTQDNEFPDSTLVTQNARRFKDSDLDSIYLLATRIFDQIPDVTDEDDGDFLESIGFSVSRPYGVDEFPRVTWRFPILKPFVLTDEYTPCPIEGFEDLILVDERLDDDEESVDRAFVTRVYDQLPGPDLDTTEITRPHGIPTRFVRKRIIIRKNQPVKNDAEAEPDGGDPTTELAVVQTEIGPNGNTKVLYRKGAIEEQMELAVLEGWEFDDFTGKLFPFTQEIVAAGTSGVDINDDAIYSDVKPVGPDFSIKTTRKSNGLDVELTYTKIVNYAWPAVLQTLNFNPIFAKPCSASGRCVAVGDFIQRFQHYFHLKEAYTGPCLATITEKWTKTSPTLTVPITLQPQELVWNLILTRGVIPRCLHTAVTIVETTGTNHPVHPFSIGVAAFPATNFTDWPGSIVASNDVSLWRGGFRQIEVIVSSPPV